jgi:hypothetical protein
MFHDALGKEITGNNITTKISRLSSKDDLSSEEHSILRWLKGKDNAEVNKIDAKKRITMKTDGVGAKKGGNAFKDTHEKDNNNVNVGKVGGLAKMTSSGKHSKVSDQLENNRVQYYESYEKEIEDMMSNKLEQAAIAARDRLVAKNNYNSSDDANNYGATHSRALSDLQTPMYGKGTGIFLDTYNGGGDFDINGNPSIAGTGRIAAFANNSSTWGYGPSKYYVAPDTSLNQGQVVIF